MKTPWGTSQNVEILAAGILSVSTASHGGIKLDRKNNAMVPAYMRRAGGWYEEDCDWAICALVFPGAFPEQLDAAKDTLKNWDPDAYEQFFGITLLEGESRTKDEQTFQERNKDKYLVLACTAVGNGMVEVFAGRGGRLSNGQYPADTAYFLVPGIEYNNQNPSRFVINEARYQRIPKGA